jgi:flagellar motor component MotA
MKLVLAFLIAASLALGGAGVAVAALNLRTESPRLLSAGVAAAILGTLAGTLGLYRLWSSREQ